MLLPDPGVTLKDEAGLRSVSASDVADCDVLCIL